MNETETSTEKEQLALAYERASEFLEGKSVPSIIVTSHEIKSDMNEMENYKRRAISH